MESISQNNGPMIASELSAVASTTSSKRAQVSGATEPGQQVEDRPKVRVSLRRCYDISCSSFTVCHVCGCLCLCLCLYVHKMHIYSVVLLTHRLTKFVKSAITTSSTSLLYNYDQLTKDKYVAVLCLFVSLE